MKKVSATFLLVCLLSGCAGYHLGPATPAFLRDIHSIAVPTFKNTTLIPRVEALVTGTVIKQFQQDGTFRITNEDSADAILKGEITAASRSPARSLQGNVLSTTEFNLALSVNYTLVGRDGRTITASGASGTTSFFVGNDVNTDERQALPLAAEQLAVRLVSQLSEGW
ncbi:MAG TPA: LptE family protein [Chthoniobacterales bacterium]|nr:LptE family protein [Chthoniobacterales bacterium]